MDHGGDGAAGDDGVDAAGRRASGSGARAGAASSSAAASGAAGDDRGDDGGSDGDDRGDDGRGEGDGAPLVACLDVDGTVYPRGSVFVKTAVMLPWYLDGDVDTATLREAVEAVARYSRGEAAARRASRFGRAVSLLRRLSGRRSAGLVSALVDRAFEHGPPGPRGGRSRDGGAARSAGGGGGPPAGDGAADADVGDYAAMRESVLGGYGRFLAGRRVEDVRAAVRRVAARHLAVDDGWARLLARLRARGPVHLVTDGPVHVARAYARRLGGDPRAVHGTRFATADGRYTGGFEPVDKAATARRVRAATRARRLVAAGDSAVDLGMRASADLFVAVAGEGDLAGALASVEPPPVDVDRFVADPALDGPPGRVVLVDGGREGAAAVGRALVAAGLLDGAGGDDGDGDGDEGTSGPAGSGRRR